MMCLIVFLGNTKQKFLLRDYRQAFSLAFRGKSSSRLVSPHLIEYRPGCHSVVVVVVSVVAIIG